MNTEEVLHDLSINIDWINDFPCHQFPGWKNVTNAMINAMEKIEKLSHDYMSIVQIGTIMSKELISRPDIVYCKDCIYCKEEQENIPAERLKCWNPWGLYEPYAVQPNDFCSRGKPRNNKD